MVVAGMETLHHDTPGQHQTGEPDRWPHHFQNDVGRYFQKRIRNKEHREGDIVLIAGELQVLAHSSDFGISN